MFGVCSWAVGLRFPARLLNATSCPSSVMAGERLRPFRVGLEPAYSTEHRTVRKVSQSRTKTSSTPFVSGPPSWLAETRFVAAEVKATKRPSPEMQGLVLRLFPLLAGPEPGAARETMLTRSVGKADVPSITFRR